MFHQIKAVIARFLRLTVGHKRHLIRTNFADVLHQVHEGIAFDVEFATGPVPEKLGESRNIIAADMAFIGARMNRQTGGPGLKRHGAEERNGRRIAVAGIADECNLVEIDRKFGQHKRGCRQKNGVIGSLLSLSNRVARLYLMCQICDQISRVFRVFRPVSPT